MAAGRRRLTVVICPDGVLSPHHPSLNAMNNGIDHLVSIQILKKTKREQDLVLQAICI